MVPAPGQGRQAATSMHTLVHAFSCAAAFVCVCMCVCVCVYVCMHVCARTCVHPRSCVRACTCVSISLQHTRSKSSPGRGCVTTQCTLLRGPKAVHPHPAPPRPPGCACVLCAAAQAVKTGTCLHVNPGSATGAYHSTNTSTPSFVLMDLDGNKVCVHVGCGVGCTAQPGQGGTLGACCTVHMILMPWRPCRLSLPVPACQSHLACSRPQPSFQRDKGREGHSCSVVCLRGSVEDARSVPAARQARTVGGASRRAARMLLPRPTASPLWCAALRCLQVTVYVYQLVEGEVKVERVEYFKS